MFIGSLSQCSKQALVHYFNHDPFLLLCVHSPYLSRNCPFRFQVVSESHPQFAQMVQGASNSSKSGVASKLDNVKRDYICFNKDMFRNIFYKKRILEAQLRGIQ